VSIAVSPRRLLRQFAQQQRGADALAVGRQGFVEQATGFVVPVVQHFVGRHLAAELGDFLLPEVIGMVGHGFGDGDGLGPFLFLLVDFQQVFQRFLVALRAAQLEKISSARSSRPALR
jgi:hypothetical protein